VIHNGVEIPPDAGNPSQVRAAARRRLGLDDAPLAVCVGRLSAQKGQDLLLRSWAGIVRKLPNARLALVGAEHLSGRRRRVALPGVIVTGFTQDVADWLAAANVVVAPSRWEGMSFAVLEAAARARSIVASDVPGMREVIGEDAGYVVPTEDPDALVGALTDRLLDPVRSDREGDAGRRRVERLFSVDRMLEKTANLYLRLARDA
jgi:glycosyltransferase involved in cell wall biosynthesis